MISEMIHHSAGKQTDMTFDRLGNNKGFSLVELIVVMAIFIIVIIATSNAFNTVLSQGGKQIRLAETNIAGVIGLEMMRLDLDHAGYGLPWSFSGAINYSEAKAGTPAADYNDATGGAPRPFVSGDGVGLNGSDYLAIKSSVVGLEGATLRKWSYMTYSSVGAAKKTWGGNNDFVADDRVIVIKPTTNAGVQDRQLILKADGTFFAKYGTLSGFYPKSQSDIHVVYGVSSSQDLKRPFNRVDYYLNQNLKHPERCAPNTGTLVKGVLPHADNAVPVEYPILDCVADMQVVYSLDTGGDGEIDTHDPTPPGTPENIREQVKEIRVYILAQEGSKDRFYIYPTQTVRVGESVNGVSWGQELDLNAAIGADWKYYRWKLYTIVIQPKNFSN